MSKNPILEVKNLNVSFHSRGQQVKAVRGVDLQVYPGEILGIVGESGSGKSVTMKAVMGILPENARIQGEKMDFEGRQLLSLRPDEYRKIRGKELTMIFQDPMTALNPLKKIGKHLEEVIMRHSKCSKAEAWNKGVEMLRLVGIPMPEERMKQYPHEFSGGMRQRVLIAMALSCEPSLLIADEPTTALDVTIQAQILDLLVEMKEKYNTSIVLITHDMGVVANVCNRIAIMYGGLIMECGTTDEIFYSPKHPYTKALLRSIPRLDLEEGERLQSIPGLPPSLVNPPAGCPFAQRCQQATELCHTLLPEYKQFSPSHKAMCFACEGQEGGSSK